MTNVKPTLLPLVGQTFLSATAFHAGSNFGLAWKAMAGRNVCHSESSFVIRASSLIRVSGFGILDHRNDPHSGPFHSFTFQAGRR